MGHENIGDNRDRHQVKNELDEILAMFFFACNVPFKAVENPYFLAFVKTLVESNINYKPPCRKTLGGSILNRVHNRIVDDKTKILDGTDSVLLCDGWKNKSVNRKYLVFTLRNIHVKQTFLSFKDFSMETEDGDTLTTHIQDAIDMAKEKYNLKVIAIITDNDAKIKCGARGAKTIDNKPLLQATCASHSGNLLIKHFVDDAFIQDIRNIVHTFREPKYESLLNMLGGKKLQNFPDTRFCYLRNTCLSIHENLGHLRAICEFENESIPQNVIETLNNVNFEAELMYIIRHLNPICRLINKCQSPDCNIADATEMWLSLQLPSDDYNDVIRQRIETAVWPVGYLANILHHRFQGNLLNNNQLQIGTEYLHTHFDDDVVREFDYYLENIDEFQQLAHQCDSPIIFWTICSLKLPRLSECAKKIMLIPASTALIEGLFSNWTYVHNVYRNRLGDEKSSKLVDIYHTVRHNNLRILEE